MLNVQPAIETKQPATADEPFQRILMHHGLELRRAQLQILQVNLGRLCNQTCRHCHVNAGPGRKELMSAEIAELCVELMSSVPSLTTLDITGGAPEMAPPFRHLVREARKRQLRVIDRCNLTILMEPGYEDLARFLADNEVDIVASLPCYTAENVDNQRGEGTFAASIAGLRLLNSLGYGAAEGADPAANRRLDLVYNPIGTGLPPPQAALEADYRKRLAEDFGIRFDRLLCITNMPVGRFRSDLLHNGHFDGYMAKLEAAFNPGTVSSLMCRNTLSVDWQGWLFDCDFNQMLRMPLGNRRRHLRDLLGKSLEGDAIALASHCLGCTAGSGSSCGGALA